jgi:transposase-like protein
MRGRRGEIPLESYKAFQRTDELSRRAYSGLMRGMSARDYARAAREFASGHGLSKTAADADFMREADARLRQLLERDLSGFDITAIFLDGKGFGDTMIIAAIGVCSDGSKVALGLWQGTTENAVVCQSLLKDLTRRGLDAAKPYLFVIDGGKGLRAAILSVFGGNAFVQRCQEHKQRNVKEHLPEHLQLEYRRKLAAAYGMANYDGALSALTDCVKELYRVNPSAARSLEEGLAETLTLHRLGLPEELRKSLRTTNCIESAFSQVGYRTGRVKRWRDGVQVQRWAGCALLMAEARWHKVSGWRLLGELREAMDRLLKERKERETRSLNLTAGG